MPRISEPILALLFAASTGFAQTTQGLISGRITDAQTGAAIAGARVSAAGAATSTRATAEADSSGYYVLPLLPPGLYRVRAAADSYQPREVQELELSVAGRIDLNLRLRPLSDVWEAGQYRSVFLPGSKAIVTFYGPDVDTSRSSFIEAPKGAKSVLESTVSQVIDPAGVRDLPLAGRDVYTMLVTQPGVTADTGTARGLGLSVNGQRPSSSNFLLDGLEDNNYLVTGPLMAIAPEAVQEYRISTNNFSAEYGRTAGFVANAVTRAGGSRWHGIGYFDLKNDALDANGFQQNRLGLSRAALHESEFGYQAGGPVRRGIFVSSAFDQLRSRGHGDPLTLLLPTRDLLDNNTAPGSTARKLLTQFRAPLVGGEDLTASTSIQPPVTLDRSLALERVDYAPGSGRHRLLGRLAVARLSRPDFIWTPYPDFVSGLAQNTYSLALGVESAPRPHLTNEARMARNTDDLHWDRTHPEIPTLGSLDHTVLPGSPAFYAYRNRSRGWEFLDNLMWVRGRHTAKAGGGLLLRGLDGYLTAGRDGFYGFQTALDFALDNPYTFSVSLARGALPRFQLPDYNRQYAYNQYFLFAQDTFRLLPRLALNYGVRYENFGAPRNTGAVKDAAVTLGSGASFPQRLAGATLLFPGPGDQPLYQSDNRDWGLRFGFSYDLSGNAKTLVRGAYGIFYDRPFDNLWQNLRNNNIVLASFDVPAFQANYLAPAASVLPSYQGAAFATDFPRLTLFQGDLRNARVQNWFFGVERQVADNWTLEVNTLGSLGRKLITTDIVNRVPRFNAALGDISYRANQGSSDYNALAAVLRYRARRAQFQAAYTWSHSIDNQSEPLAGDFFDLNFVRITAAPRQAGLAVFSRQFDSAADRGNSDFDQRHNLVFYSIWDLPGFLRGWKFSQLAAFRTGFPYTVSAPSLAAVYNNRADILDPAHAVLDAPRDVPGGKLLLDAQAFATPPPGRLGNSGRNAIHGPGLFNVDLSLGRSFALPRLGESGRVTVRADVFNFLNHANLNNPDSLVGSPTFGVASFGRVGRDPGFPALAPLTETARQVQLIFRVEF